MSEFGEPWTIHDECGLIAMRKRNATPVAIDFSPRDAERTKSCVNALAGLTDEQIAAINWAKVPVLVEAAKRLCSVDTLNFASRMFDIDAALAAVERK